MKDCSKYSENFPINDTRNNFVLEFIDYFIDPPRYSIEECTDRGLTYSVPSKQSLNSIVLTRSTRTLETVIQDVYLGTIPYMTPRGTFIINGSERMSRLSAPPLSRGILRTEHPYQRHKALFCPHHTFQRFLDRIRHGHQQCDVCLY